MTEPWRRRAGRAADRALACTALLLARVAIAVTPSGWLLRSPRNRSVPASPQGEAAARRFASAIDRASGRGPIRGTCLVRAVALRWLLTARGLEPGPIRIGARRTADGRFAAHAWLEYGGLKLGADGSRAAGFAPLTGDPLPATIREMR